LLAVGTAIQTLFLVVLAQQILVVAVVELTQVVQGVLAARE
jgi:hypothetical protein